MLVRVSRRPLVPLFTIWGCFHICRLISVSRSGLANRLQSYSLPKYLFDITQCPIPASMGSQDINRHSDIGGLLHVTGAALSADKFSPSERELMNAAVSAALGRIRQHVSGLSCEDSQLTVTHAQLAFIWHVPVRATRPLDPASRSRGADSRLGLDAYCHIKFGTGQDHRTLLKFLGSKITMPTYDHRPRRWAG